MAFRGGRSSHGMPAVGLSCKTRLAHQQQHPFKLTRAPLYSGEYYPFPLALECPIMRRTCVAVLLGFLLSSAAEAQDAKPAKKTKGKFTIGKDTTYVTGPVDKQGYIDYQSALNERLSKGVTPDSNS